MFCSAASSNKQYHRHWHLHYQQLQSLITVLLPCGRLERNPSCRRQLHHPSSFFSRHRLRAAPGKSQAAPAPAGATSSSSRLGMAAWGATWRRRLARDLWWHTAAAWRRGWLLVRGISRCFPWGLPRSGSLEVGVTSAGGPVAATKGRWIDAEVLDDMF